MRACDVASDGSSTASVPGRYASAIYDLARDSSQVAEVEAQLTAFQSLLDESEDLRRMIKSPVYAADEQARAIGALLEKAGIGGTTANFLGLVAKNRRLFAVPEMIKGFKALAAQGRGEVTATVTAAQALTDEQIEELKSTLRQSIGKDVTLDIWIDPEILGGLIVKVGSRMVDSSLRTKLNNMRVGLKRAAA